MLHSITFLSIDSFEMKFFLLMITQSLSKYVVILKICLIFNNFMKEKNVLVIFNEQKVFIQDYLVKIGSEHFDIVDFLDIKNIILNKTMTSLINKSKYSPIFIRSHLSDPI